MYSVTDKILLTGTAVWPILLLINILRHFRNAPLYFLLFLPHGLVEDIFLVIYHVRVK